MKTSSVTALIFAAVLLLAIPTSAQPSETDVENSINQWIFDVDQVNAFLNQAAAGSLSDVAGAAASTEQIALDEPVQLGILSGVQGLSDAANNAVQLLQQVFGNVPTDLQNIVNDPSPDNVQTQLASINSVRCQNVLPALAILWPAAAAAVGAPPPPPPGLPNACNQ
jgi:hypothetical protein